jgi:UDP-GlcNAc:undecaprenyl-phosphate GlcNAc-1-phosphate transferase
MDPTEFDSVSDVLLIYWPVALGSFLVALVATPLCRTLARRKRWVDRPDDFLKPHTQPIPYLGGVAIFLGWAVGIGIAFLLDAEGYISLRISTLVAVLVAGAIIMAVGLFDDIRLMPPKTKLALNIAVGVLVIAAGVGLDTFTAFIRATALQPGDSIRWLEVSFSVAFGLFIIVGACNATNLIDGLDGLCSGSLGIISVGFFVLALHLAVWNPTEPIAHERIVLALAMLGAAIGFLPYNVNPATIFMGDAGSMLLGLNAAILILLFSEPRNIRWVLGAIMVFGLPIADMSLTLLRRWRNARPLMVGDRSHFYDQLVDRGFSVRQVVAISYALTAGFVLVGCIGAILLRIRYAVPIYAAIVFVTILAVWKFNMVALLPPEQRHADPPHDSTDSIGKAPYRE